MEDVEIVRGGPTIWPWILGLFVLAVLIWVAGELCGTDTRQDLPTVPEPTSASTDR